MAFVFFESNEILRQSLNLKGKVLRYRSKQKKEAVLSS